MADGTSETEGFALLPSRLSLVLSLRAKSSPAFASTSSDGATHSGGHQSTSRGSGSAYARKVGRGLTFKLRSLPDHSGNLASPTYAAPQPALFDGPVFRLPMHPAEASKLDQPYGNMLKWDHDDNQVMSSQIRGEKGEAEKPCGTESQGSDVEKGRE